MKKLILRKYALSLIFLLAVLNGCANINNYARSVDKTDQWEQVGDKLLTNFINMYNLHIIEEADDEAYPYKGWFFGWAIDQCNSGALGCDATYAARANSLQGPWEVYSGDDRQGRPVWDATLNPARWVAVIAGGESNFHNWHNGDPSVVRKNGKYYMVYSATGFNKDGIAFGQPGDTDSDISVVMAATSDDGLRWNKSETPVLIYTPQWGQSTGDMDEYMHPMGSYHRPSLMIEDGKFKVWFDGYVNGSFHMLYAENAGDFMAYKDWNIVRGLDNPALPDFPNPDVIKIDDLYFAFGDPSHPEGRETGWSSRKITWAVSLNGQDWKPVGHMKADAGWRANQVPEAPVVTESGDTWVYVSYGTMIKWHFHQDSIRMKRWQPSADEFVRLRELASNSEEPD